MKIAYIRVSTIEQNTARQLDGMEFDKIFTDKLSGVNSNREELIKLIDFVREDDEVWIHSIDRLARSLMDLHAIVKQITNKGAIVNFKSENLTFDSGETNPHHMLYFQMLGAFAQFERSINKQRQAEGIAIAREKGAYSTVGRKPLSADIKSEIRTLTYDGVGPTKIAEKLDISRATVYRVLSN